MRRPKGIGGILLVVLAGLGFAGLYLSPLCTQETFPTLEVFETREWLTTGELVVGELLLKTSSTQETPRLLLKRDGLKPIYQWTPGNQTLTLTTNPVWNEATQPTTRCNTPQTPNSGQFHYSEDGDPILNHHRIVPYGEHIVEVWPSPKTNFAAAVSAEGPLQPGWIPFLGSPGFKGKHYMEIFKSDGTRIGQPIQLPITTREGGLRGCWSADERYIVYTDNIYSKLVIATTGT